MGISGKKTQVDISSKKQLGIFEEKQVGISGEKTSWFFWWKKSKYLMFCDTRSNEKVMKLEVELNNPFNTKRSYLEIVNNNNCKK